MRIDYASCDVYSPMLRRLASAGEYLVLDIGSARATKMFRGSDVYLLSYPASVIDGVAHVNITTSQTHR